MRAHDQSSYDYFHFGFTRLPAYRRLFRDFTTLHAGAYIIIGGFSRALVAPPLAHILHIRGY